MRSVSGCRLVCRRVSPSVCVEKCLWDGWMNEWIVWLVCCCCWIDGWTDGWIY